MLSAVCQIDLSSNDQITTRCPLRMEQSDHVRAEVRIKWDDPRSEYATRSNWTDVQMDDWEHVKEHISSA